MSHRSDPVIAIDGPAGTGKSSVTKLLSKRLGYVHVDTGALYRSIALLSLGKGVDTTGTEISPRDKNTIVDVAKTAQFEFKLDQKKNPANRIFVNGEDVTRQIRTPEVGMAASKVSAIPEVRAALLDLQRKLGGNGGAILEGRDIGTVIFPDAEIKFFLTASADERAKRRLAELEALGQDAPTFKEIKRQISERDLGDSTRAIAPLKKAVDAIEIDTTMLTLDEVVGLMERTVKEKWNGS